MQEHIKQHNESSYDCSDISVLLQENLNNLDDIITRFSVVDKKITSTSPKLDSRFEKLSDIKRETNTWNKCSLQGLVVKNYLPSDKIKHSISVFIGQEVEILETRRIQIYSHECCMIFMEFLIFSMS